MADDYEQRKEFSKEINTLSRPELEELYRILKREGGAYSENSNGIFFDLATISESTFVQINEYLNFCLKTRQEDALRLNELETIRIQNENYIDNPDISV
jgi:hypothetical protein